MAGMSRRFQFTAVSVTTAVALVFALSLFACISGTSAAVMFVNATNNNLARPTYGVAGYNYLRLIPARYGNATDATPISGLPSAREVSNKVFGRVAHFSAHSISDALPYWGQFLAHDITLTKGGSESFPIPVPTCDYHFDPKCTGTKTIGFSRGARSLDANGAWTHLNMITSFVDGSCVYGATDDRANAIRTFSDGKMNMSTGELPPFNVPELEQANAQNAKFFLTGDIRGNENPLLQSFHTVFLREHNRKVTELKTANPSWTDQQLYDYGRAWVAALLQKITFSDYLPPLLGKRLPTYTGYNASVDPRIDIFFTVAAFRYGHSAINMLIPRINADGTTHAAGHLLLRDGRWNMQPLQSHGIEPILRGLGQQIESAVDNRVVSDMRNAFDLGDYFDIASFNIQRGREAGLPSHNDMRAYFGLPRIQNFTHLTGGDTDSADILASLYPTIDDVDPWVAGLSEPENPGALLGALFAASMEDQFRRLRDGDRFYFEAGNLPLSADEIAEVRQTRLSDIIRRNFLAPVGTGLVSGDLFRKQPSPLESTGTSATADGTYAFSAKLNTKILLEWTIRDIKWLDARITYQGTGWVGFGMGSKTMPKSDIILGYVEDDTGKVVIEDRYASDNALPDTDVSLGNTNDITNINGSQISGVTVLKFSRLLKTGDPLDYAIVEGTASPVVFAFSTTDSLGYHGQDNRAIATIDFYTGQVTCGDAASTPFNVFAFHGGLMGVVFCIAYPLGILVARYGKSYYLWLVVHVEIMLFGASDVLILVAVALSGAHSASHTISSHGIIGMLIASCIILQVLLGLSARYFMKKSSATLMSKVTRIGHMVLGYAMLILGLINANKGISKLLIGKDDEKDMAFGFYYAWVSVITATFFILEANRFYIAHGHRIGFSKVAPSDHTPLTRSKSQAEMRGYTWKDISERVSNDGAHLFVVNRIVYDLGDWVSVHPGGERILLAAVGTDVTREFMGVELAKAESHEHLLDDLDYDDGGKLGWMARIFSPAGGAPGKALGLTPNPSGDYKGGAMPMSPLPTPLLRRRSSSAFKNRAEPQPVHAHSGIAWRSLRNFAVGRLLDSENGIALDHANNAGPPTLKRGVTSMSMVSVGSNSEEFARYTLVSKRTLTHPAAVNAVRLFRFAIEPDSSLAKAQMRTGQHVIVHAVVNGRSLQRSYTLVGYSAKAGLLELAIKIYPKGPLSSHLDQIAVGASVKLRGPLGHQLLCKTPIAKTFNGCWDHVGMIAGGAGITPFINLISHHVKKGPYKTRKGMSCNLLFANSTALDIFYGERLADLADETEGYFKVFHMLSRPPTEWDGMSGRITTEAIRISMPPPPGATESALKGRRMSADNVASSSLNLFGRHKSLMGLWKETKQDDDDETAAATEAGEAGTVTVTTGGDADADGDDPSSSQPRDEEQGGAVDKRSSSSARSVPNATEDAHAAPAVVVAAPPPALPRDKSSGVAFQRHEPDLREIDSAFSVETSIAVTTENMRIFVCGTGAFNAHVTSLLREMGYPQAVIVVL